MKLAFPENFASIVNDKAASPLDIATPFSFTEWSRRVSAASDFTQYQAYINAWFLKKGTDKVSIASQKKDIYTKLLSEIYLYHSTEIEKNFLKNLDFTNPAEAEIAAPLVAKKLNDISRYFKLKRHANRYKPVHVDISGTKDGIEKTVFNVIIDHIRENSSDFATLLAYVKANFQINVLELFDTYQHHFNSGSISSIEVGEVDPELFNSFDDVLFELIKSYPIVVKNIKEPLLSVSPGNSVFDKIVLPKKDFTDTNSGETILELKQKFIKKFIGCNLYYITGKTDGSYDYGILVQSNDTEFNELNVTQATVTSTRDESYLVTKDKLGFFLPKNQGIIKLKASRHAFEIDKDSIEVGKTYVFPDPAIYGNVVGATGENSSVPVIHITSNQDFVRYSGSLAVIGEVKNTSKDVLTFGYVASEQKHGNKHDWLLSKKNLGAITDYQEDLFGDIFVRFESSPDWTSNYLVDVISKSDYLSLGVPKTIIIDGGFFLNEDGTAEYDYYAEFRDIVNGELLYNTNVFVNAQDSDLVPNSTPSFEPVTNPYILDYGTFSDPRIQNDRVITSMRIIDSGEFTTASDVDRVEYHDFPRDTVNYGFDTVYDGSVHSYYGGSVFVRADEYYPSDNFEQISESGGLRTLDGGYFEDPDYIDITETASVYLENSSALAITDINQKAEAVSKKTAFLTKIGGGAYFVKMSSGEVYDLSTAFSKIIAKYPVEAGVAVPEKLWIDEDFVVHRSTDKVAFEKISLKNGVFETETLSNSVATFNGSFTEPFFSSDSNDIIVPTVYLDAAVFNIELHVFNKKSLKLTKKTVFSDINPISGLAFAANKQNNTVMSKSDTFGVANLTSTFSDVQNNVYIFTCRLNLITWDVSDETLIVPDAIYDGAAGLNNEDFIESP